MGLNNCVYHGFLWLLIFMQCCKTSFNHLIIAFDYFILFRFNCFMNPGGRGNKA